MVTVGRDYKDETSCIDNTQIISVRSKLIKHPVGVLVCEIWFGVLGNAFGCHDCTFGIALCSGSYRGSEEFIYQMRYQIAGQRPANFRAGDLRIAHGTVIFMNEGLLYLIRLSTHRSSFTLSHCTHQQARRSSLLIHSAWVLRGNGV